MTASIETELELKENGNAAFKLGQYKKATNYYTQAINMILEKNGLSNADTLSEDSSNFLNLLRANDCLIKSYNNRAQCYFNTDKYELAAEDATRGKRKRETHSVDWK